MKSEHYQVSAFRENPDEILEDTDEETPPSERESLYRLWKGLSVDITSEDIDEIRKEMWMNFPREDI